MQSRGEGVENGGDCDAKNENRCQHPLIPLPTPGLGSGGERPGARPQGSGLGPTSPAGRARQVA